MKFCFAEAMIDPSFYVPLAQAAESAGFDSFLVADSIAYPEHSDSVYPFTPDGSREFLDGKPFLEPFALISALGTVTERIRFTISVLKLPIRHPLHVAKLASTAAFLSGDRLTLGVGLSPWPEDFEMTGTPWARRGRRMDECIDVLQRVLTGEYHEHHGEAFDIPSIKIAPVPARSIPILVGGHSDAALRRASRVDGWIHGGGDADELVQMIDRLHDLREQAGVAGEPFEIQVISGDAYTVDGLRRLDELGVTEVIVGFRWPYEVGPDQEPLQTKIDNINRYAERTIGRFRG